MEAKPHLLFPPREVLSDGVDDTWMESARVRMKIGGWKVAERTQPTVAPMRAPWLKRERNEFRMLWSGPLEETLEMALCFTIEHFEVRQELLPPTLRVMGGELPSARQAAIDGRVPEDSIAILDQSLEHRPSARFGQGRLVSELRIQHVGHM